MRAENPASRYEAEGARYFANGRRTSIRLVQCLDEVESSLFLERKLRLIKLFPRSKVADYTLSHLCGFTFSAGMIQLCLAELLEFSDGFPS